MKSDELQYIINAKIQQLRPDNPWRVHVKFHTNTNPDVRNWTIEGFTEADAKYFIDRLTNSISDSVNVLKTYMGGKNSETRLTIERCDDYPEKTEEYVWITMSKKE